MILTLPIEIGRRYLRRDGKIVTARPGHPYLYEDVAYVGDGEEASRYSFEHVWLRSGLVGRPDETFEMDLTAGPLPNNLTEWGGGECPVNGATEVEVWFRGGQAKTQYAKLLRWDHRETPGDIIAYRLVRPEKAKPTGHPHAELMAQYAEDAKTHPEPWKLWQKRVVPQDAWVACALHPAWTKGIEYRRRPRTIKIGDREVPEPLREEPAFMTQYWVPDVHASSPNLAVSLKWVGDKFALRWLARGLVHLTEEAATAHAEALLAFSARRD